MLNKLRILNTPGRLRLAKGYQLLPTTPLPLHSTQKEIFNVNKTFSSKISTRCLHTATVIFEADKLCSEIGILNLAGRETVEFNERSTVSSEQSHQAKGKRDRVSPAGESEKEDQNGSIKQAQRECPRQGQQGRSQRQQPQRQLQTQNQQIVDLMNPNQLSNQPGYPPIWQGGFGDQQQQQQQYPNQQQWPQYGQYGMGYAPPSDFGYGFAPPLYPNTFTPGMGMPNWQQPAPQSYSGAGRRDYHTSNNYTNNNNPQYSQASDRYRPRSPISNSRGGQGRYNDYNNSYSNSYNSRSDYYRPRSPRANSDFYRPRSPGPYSGGRRYNSNDAYAGNYRPDSYRTRSPGPYYSRGGQVGGYNNQYNNNIHGQQTHSQQKQRQFPTTSNPYKPPKLNKKAKAREAAARKASGLGQPQSQSQSQDQRPGKWPPAGTGDIPRSASDPISPPSRGSGGIPSPTSAYLQRASLPAVSVSEARPILVVIDLNGTLLHRPSRRQPSKFVERPFAKQFLECCIDTFKVVIWSSARPRNVEFMCNQLLTKEQRGKVVAIWGRDRFGLTQADYDKRVQCYKRLTVLWADPAIKAAMPEGKGEWDQGNTVLIDDSAEKARSEPYNCITLPEFVGDLEEKPEVLPMVQEYLNVLARQQDISMYIRVKPFDINVDSGKPVTGDEGVALASPAAAQAEGSE